MSHAPIFPHVFPQTLLGAAVPGAIFTAFEYGEVTPYITAISGALAVSTFLAGWSIRFNNLVVLTLTPWGGANATASTIQTYSSPISPRLRPLATQTACGIIKRGTQRSGSAEITSAGVITVYGDETGGNFNNGQACQYLGGAIFMYSVT